MSAVLYLIFFFFQAEDGIRDESVTGVQTWLFRSDRKSTRLNSSHTLISHAVSLDRKSTRLNSSHTLISYAVFCLKKKNTSNSHTIHPIYLTSPSQSSILHTYV